MTWSRVASLSGAGLFAGATAWALHQQVGYTMASWACGSAAAPGIWLSSVVALVLLLAGGAFSFMAWRRPSDPSDAGRPRRFLALVGVMAALLFFYASALQASAAFFLPGCTG